MTIHRTDRTYGNRVLPDLAGNAHPFTGILLELGRGAGQRVDFVTRDQGILAVATDAVVRQNFSRGPKRGGSGGVGVNTIIDSYSKKTLRGRARCAWSAHI